MDNPVNDKDIARFAMERIAILGEKNDNKTNYIAPRDKRLKEIDEAINSLVCQRNQGNFEFVAGDA